MEPHKYMNIASGMNYEVQYIDVTNNPVFMGIESGLLNTPTVKLRRSIDLTNVCEENKEGILPGTEFTTAELQAILSDNTEDINKNIQPLEVPPINSKTIDAASSSHIEFDLEESETTDEKSLINLNTPVYIDVTNENDAGVVIETDIAGNVEIGTDSTSETNNTYLDINNVDTSDFLKEFNIKSNEINKIRVNTAETTSNASNDNNLEIPEEELRLIQNLTNQHNNSNEFMNNVTAYNQSKNYEILKAAKSLYSKRTRTLWHWIDPKIPKAKLKNTVLLAWDNLPAWQKQIYISQVLGKFSMDVVTPMVNPQLAGITATPQANREPASSHNNVAKKRMYVHKPTNKWKTCYNKTKKKATNETINRSPFL